MSELRITKLISMIIYTAVGILVLYLGFKYLLPWTAPFVLSFITALCFEPIITSFQEHISIKRWLISASLTILLLAALVIIIHFIITNVFSALTDFLSDLPNSLGNLPQTFGGLNDKIYSYINSAPPGVREYMQVALNSIIRTVQQLPGELSGGIFKLITSIAGSTPKILVFIATYAVGVFFISCNYSEVRSFLLRQIPPRMHGRILSLKTGILKTMLKWLKAQLMLMGITFLELTAGFILLKLDTPLLLALITALIDALPILGVGTVLIPWAIYELIIGSTSFAVGLILLYAVVTLIRSILEPKFIGSQLGLHPVAALLAVYIGFASTGVLGMILFPIGLIILKQLNEENIIHLWK